MRKPLSRPMNSFTAIPNEYFDDWMKEINPSETVILNFIIRKTLGFQKPEDWISLSQFEEGTPLSKPTIILHLKYLVKKEMIFRREEGTVESGNQRVFYRLNIDFGYDTCKESIQVGGKESLHTKYTEPDLQKNCKSADIPPKTITTPTNTSILYRASIPEKKSINYYNVLQAYAKYYLGITGCAYTISKTKDLAMLKRIYDSGIITEFKGWKEYFDYARSWINSESWITDKTPTLNLLSSADTINKIRIFLKRDYTRGNNG